MKNKSGRITSLMLVEETDVLLVKPFKKDADEDIISLRKFNKHSIQDARYTERKNGRKGDSLLSVYLMSKMKQTTCEDKTEQSIDDGKIFFLGDSTKVKSDESNPNDKNIFSQKKRLSYSNFGSRNNLQDELKHHTHLEKYGSMHANEQERYPLPSFRPRHSHIQEKIEQDATFLSFVTLVQQFIHPKMLLSMLLWIICYIIMAIFGGSVAYMHFPRNPSRYPEPLPDYGHDAIPEWCPMIYVPFLHEDNVQSIVLLIMYLLILIGAACKCSMSRGRLIIQQFLHLNSIIFLTRTTTVGVTGLNQPNPRCVVVQHDDVTYIEAFKFVLLRGFPPRACGDLVYSGHIACLLVCVVIFHKHSYFHLSGYQSNWKQMITGLSYGMVWSLTLIGTYFVLSCRSHYSVDVVLAYYFTFFIQEFYFSRSEGKTIDFVAKWVQWLEDQNDGSGSESCTKDVETPARITHGMQEENDKEQSEESYPSGGSTSPTWSFGSSNDRSSGSTSSGVMIVLNDIGKSCTISNNCEEERSETDSSQLL